jgi:hypothetical protein
VTVPLGRGSDPELLHRELLHLIRTSIRDNPRSLQTRIGPSELGTPCDRWLSHKLLDTLPVNDRQAPWLPTIGTAVHAWLEDTFAIDNVRHVENGRAERWLLEQRLNVGTVGGQSITGSCDLYDTITATVVDWKIVGKTRLEKYKRHGPGEQYRVQAHAYGRGWVRKGFAVEQVAICFLPRNGELTETVWWHEPYDEQVAVAALARVEAVAMANAVLGAAAPAAMSTTDWNCGYCDYFQMGAADLTKACPGDPTRPRSNDSVVSLIAPKELF